MSDWRVVVTGVVDTSTVHEHGVPGAVRLRFVPRACLGIGPEGLPRGLRVRRAPSRDPRRDAGTLGARAAGDARRAYARPSFPRGLRRAATESIPRIWRARD